MSFTHNAPDKPLRAARAPVHSGDTMCCVNAQRQLDRLKSIGAISGVVNHRLLWNVHANKYLHIASVRRHRDGIIVEVEFDGIAWQLVS